MGDTSIPTETRESAPTDIVGQTASSDKPGWLESIEWLYDQSRYIDAWEQAREHGPLTEWTHPRAAVVAGRLAANLGSTRLAAVLHWRGRRRHPQDLDLAIYHAYSQLQRCGPLRALELLDRLPVAGTQPSRASLSHLHTLRANVIAEFRDFTAADEEFARARELDPNDPWLHVVEAGLLEKQDRYEEGLVAARRSIELNPLLRPGLQSVAHLLQVVGRREEALAFLKDATQCTQCGTLVAQLALLETELEHHDQALTAYARYLELSPLADKSTLSWVNRNRTALSCRLGRLRQAREWCEELPEDYYRELGARLELETPPRKRVHLPVRFVRQHHMTCAPATLSALADYWELPVAQLELAEKICYDGTPAHSERKWARSSGFFVREFTVTWTAACALLDKGIPFTLTTSEATSGHLQAVVGYDELRQSLAVRDPFFYNVSEAICPAFLDRYQATGPRGMVMVPVARAHLLTGLPLPDAELYDLLHNIQAALDQHRRPEAYGILEQLQAKDPQHRLTLTAARVLAGYDTNSAALLQSVDRLLELFPDDGNLNLTRYGCLTEHANREARLRFLRDACQRPGVDPVFFIRLGQELREDSTQLDNAKEWIRRALRYRAVDAEYLKAFADVLWDAQSHELARKYYRFAACVGERQEPYARAYFSAVRLLRAAEEGLKFLQARAARHGDRSAQPYMTLHDSLSALGRVDEAFAVLEEAIHRRPRDGELRLFVADAHARYGRVDEAAGHLETAAGDTKRTHWLRTAAALAAYGSRRADALCYWREVLESEPLAMDANDAVAWLIAETKGRHTAIRFVNDVCRRFPQHCGLLHLRIDVVREETADILIDAVRALINVNPVDAWAWRELALVLLETRRNTEAREAADEAVRLAPQDTFGYSTRGAVHLGLENLAAAQEDFRKALSIAVDNTYAMEQLIETAGPLECQRAALRFAQEELRRQLTFGQGLQCFRSVARALLPPQEVLDRLKEAREARPDLWSAWSGVVLQLNDMDRTEEALRLAEEACRRFPFVPRLWYDRAQVHRALLQPAQATTALEQALAIHGSYGDAARMLAELQEKAASFDAARQTLERACARAPLDAVNRGCLAAFEWRRGHRAAGIEHLQHSLRLAPGYSWAWSTLREWAVTSGEPNLAVTLARDLVERRPAEPRSWALLAECLAERDDPKTIETMDKALALNPRNADLLDQKARLLSRADRFEEAMAVCSQLDPAPPSLQMRAAWIEAQRGRLKLAIDRMTSVLSDHPAYFGAWQLLSWWHEQVGDLSKAAEAADRMSQLSPQDPVPLVRSGDLRLREGDTSGAMTRFQRAFDLDPACEAAGLSLLDLRLDQGGLTGAEEVLTRLARHHDSDHILACKVKLNVRQKRPDDALQTFARLCGRSSSDDRHPLFNAAAELEGRKTRSRMEKEIKVRLEDSGSHPFLGALWVARRFRKQRYGVDARLHRLFENKISGRNTLTYYLDALGGKYNETSGAGDALTPSHLARCFKSVFRRHREQLRADDLLWGKAGYWLVTLRDYRRAAQWLADWPTRKHLESWMIYNHALALEVIGRWEEAIPVIRHGLGLRQDAGLYTSFAALSAMEEALAGDRAQATNLIGTVNTEGAGTLDKAIFAFAEAACLAANEHDEECRELKRQIKARLCAGTGKLAPASLHEIVRVSYRRTIMQICAQPGLSGMKAWGWWNYRRSNWAWIAIIGLLTPPLALMVPIGPILLIYLWKRALQ